MSNENEELEMSGAYKVQLHPEIEKAIKLPRRPYGYSNRYAFSNGKRTDEVIGSGYNFFIEHENAAIDGYQINVFIPIDVYYEEKRNLANKKKRLPFFEIKDFVAKPGRYNKTFDIEVIDIEVTSEKD